MQTLWQTGKLLVLSGGLLLAACSGGPPIQEAVGPTGPTGAAQVPGEASAAPAADPLSIPPVAAAIQPARPTNTPTRAPTAAPAQPPTTTPVETATTAPEPPTAILTITPLPATLPPTPTSDVPAQVRVGQAATPTAVVVAHAGLTAEQQQLLAGLPAKGPAAELFNEVWLNSEPLKLADLRDKVVLIEFWTFG